MPLRQLHSHRRYRSYRYPLFRNNLWYILDDARTLGQLGHTQLLAQEFAHLQFLFGLEGVLLVTNHDVVGFEVHLFAPSENVLLDALSLIVLLDSTLQDDL